jgi:hypothetical protein
MAATGHREHGPTDGAFSLAARCQVLPSTEDRVLERRSGGFEELLANRVLRTRALLGREGVHLTLLNTPTILPSSVTSWLRIGFIDLFSGCSRMWSFSRK